MPPPSSVVIATANTAFQDVHLTPTTAPVAYAGSGTPWDSAATTPFEIANNDVTGERWVITAPVPETVQDGAPPFAIRQQTIDLLYRNREVLIPVQAWATTTDNLADLLVVLRSSIVGAMTQQGVVLKITYGGDTTSMSIEAGTFQEDYRFWNDEQQAIMMRGMLRLQCSIGWRDDSAFTTLSGTAANGSAVYALTGTGETRSSIGQPTSISAVHTSNAIRTFMMASTAAFSTGTYSESLITSSTSGATSTATRQFTLQSFARATRFRFLCAVTSPNTHLQVRAQVALNGGVTLYEGPWISTGTNTTLIDLGFFAVPQYVRSYYTTGIVRIGFRSSSGSATAGTLARIIALEYYQFARIVTTVSEDVYLFTSQHAFIGEMAGAPVPDVAFVRAGVPPVPIEQPPIQGQLPRTYAGASLWYAWLDAGVYNSAATANISYNATRLYHTMSGGA